MSRQPYWSAPAKANNRKIDAEYLTARTALSLSKGYPKQKWVQFCEVMMADGFSVTLYEARKTFSKYITVSRDGDGRKFKVRYSNHRPIVRLEKEESCDFFVGVSNFKTTTTEQAIAAVRAFFSEVQS